MFPTTTAGTVTMAPMKHYPGGDDVEQQRKIEHEGPPRRHGSDPNYHGPEHRRQPAIADDFVNRVRNEPITFNKLVAVFTIYFAITQAIAQWRAATVEPAAFRRLTDRVDSMAVTVGELAKTLQKKEAGDNFFYYSICYSWKQQRSTTQYPAFCDRPEIQQYDPLGRAIRPPAR